MLGFVFFWVEELLTKKGWMKKLWQYGPLMMALNSSVLEVQTTIKEYRNSGPATDFFLSCYRLK